MAPNPLNVFDVEAYGAVGDGRTDDARAIQAAIDDASTRGGGIVWFPAGHFRLASGLTTDRQVVLAGTGWETGGSNGSWLRVDNTEFVPLTLSGRGCIMRDIAIAHEQIGASRYSNGTIVPLRADEWAPYNYPFAIDIKADDILLENILLLNPT
jgi:hypothetical protein